MSYLLIAYLELISAKAKALAEDYKENKLWEGDLSKGLAEIGETLQKAIGAIE